MKYILFVRNAQVAEEITAQIGEKSVVGVFYLEDFEKYPSDVLPEEFPLNGIEKIFSRGGAIMSIKQ